MGILIALIPVVAWGSIGLVSGRLGGSAAQQTLGMTMGAVVFGIIAWFIYQPALDAKVWIAGTLSGLLWVVGQSGQFTAMKAIGVSKTIPLSTGLQLAGNALVGVLIFHEWVTGKQYTLGTIAVIALIIGATLTSRRDKRNVQPEESDNTAAGARALTYSTVGYVIYTGIIKSFEKWGGVGDPTKFTHAVVLPQSIGMFIGALVFVIMIGARREMWQLPTWKNIITGLFWGTGNLFMFLATVKVGLAVAYSMAQMGIIISTFGSIWLLGERKTHWEMVNIVIGSVLIIAGGIMLGTM
ncbi:GRP family sugar transporter [Furfurilactobacillus entadae]|uniref:GRP family sugar transporter n=1 Tax=Furfurilactobacillus entadae TaxID=2922307 RepID=UPI0035E5AD9B